MHLDAHAYNDTFLYQYKHTPLCFFHINKIIKLHQCGIYVSISEQFYTKPEERAIIDDTSISISS